MRHYLRPRPDQRREHLLDMDARQVAAKLLNGRSWLEVWHFGRHSRRRRLTERSSESCDGRNCECGQTILGVVSANSSSLKSIETSFHPDLNGDGVVGVFAPALGNAALSSAMLSDGASANTFVFAPNFGNTNVSDIHPGEDIVTFDHTLSTITAVVGSNMPELGHAYEVTTVDAYDMVAVQAPTPPTLQQHPADFYFV